MAITDPNARHVTKGFVGGHMPTRGYYSETKAIEEVIASILEAVIGRTPIPRAKIDIDGDGVYEVTELDKLLAIGNISRSIEYTVGKSSFGGCSLSLCNNDSRFTDAWVNALTYFDPSNPTRYHMARTLIELNFDWIHKDEEDYWLPLFTGFITGKKEIAADKTVSISLMDEYKKIFDRNLAPKIKAEDLLTYVSATDDRQIQLGTYNGKHAVFNRAFTSKDDHTLIPLVSNIAGDVVNSHPQYRFLMCQALNITTKFDADISADSNKKLWLWLWNDKGDWANVSQKQWGYIDSANWAKSVSIAASFLTDATVTVNLLDGNTTSFTMQNYLTGAAYVTDNQRELDPLAGLEVETESNPIKFLYDILRNVIGLPDTDFDASGDDYDVWIPSDHDPADGDSWDSSAAYLDDYPTKVTVQIQEKTKATELIDFITEITRGGFYVGYGIKVGEDTTKRIKYVIHQPRNEGLGFHTLDSSRIQNPSINRSIVDVKNYITVSDFNYNTVQKLREDSDLYVSTDANSITKYGRQDLEIVSDASAKVFLYDSSGYAQFLTSHFLMLFAEPPKLVDLKTDLKGRLFDLKSLIGIKETEHLRIDPDDSQLSGLCEVYKIGWNTRTYKIALMCLWAGYLIFPDGDARKRWAYSDESWCEDDNPWTVDVAGAVVTKASGDNFLSGEGWEGTEMIIDGNRVTIVTVDSTTQLTIDTDLGALTGVNMETYLEYYCW